MDSNNREFRNYNNNQLPSYYHWSLHLISNVLIIGACIVFSISSLTSFSIISLIQLSFLFIIWVLIEYFIHRNILHGKFRVKLKSRESHAVYHHGYFTHHKMNLEKYIDLNRILLFTKDLALIVILSISISSVINFFDHQIAMLSLLASALYMTLYETIHFLCHWRTSVKIKLLNKIISHHIIHHKKEEMQHYNFAVVFPFVDSLFKTRKK